MCLSALFLNEYLQAFQSEANERATSSKSKGAVWPEGLPHACSTFSSLYLNQDTTGEAPGRVSSLLKRTNGLPGLYGRFESCS